MDSRSLETSKRAQSGDEERRATTASLKRGLLLFIFPSVIHNGPRLSAIYAGGFLQRREMRGVAALH